MTPNDLAEPMLGVLKMIADKTRLRILGLLAEREHTSPELAVSLHLEVETLLPQLALLSEHGLVSSRLEAGRQLYRLELREVWKLLKDSRDSAPPEVTPEEVPDVWEREIINRFFSGGKLKEIPTQRKKRRVVLERIAREFDPRFPHPEIWVNETLKQFHPDCASLRRYMVDEGLMTRHNGIYRRLVQSEAVNFEP